MRLLSSIPAFAVVIGLAWTPGLEAQVIPKGKWIEVTTERFAIYSNAGAGKVEDIAVELSLLEQVLSRISAGTPAEGGRPLTIVIFRNQAAFEPYMRSPPVKGTIRSWEGFYGTTADYLMLNGSKPTAELLPWAYSAYADLYLSQRYPTLPYWLRTGLSSFYETAQIDRKGSVRLGYPDSYLLRTLRERSILPTRQFFQIDRTSSFLSTRDGIAVYDAQAWLLTHFITSGGGKGLELGSRFFALIGRGMSEEEALRQAFGLDLSSFESALRGYVNSPTLPVFTLKNQNFLVPSIEPEPMADHEVAYQLGLYLATAHTPPPSQLTEEHLLPLAEGGDRAGDALAAIGELRRRSGRTEDATALFERALAGDPRSSASYYFIARHLQEVDGTASRADVREALERAVALDPDFGDAYVLLDRAIGDDEAAGIANLEKAVALLADRPGLAYNLVLRYLNAKDLEGAKRVVTERLGSASAASYRERAQRQIEQAEQNLGRRQLYDAYNRAINLFNQRDYAAAREALAPLLETSLDGQLQRGVQELLEALEAVDGSNQPG